MILTPDRLIAIAEAAREAQRRVYYEAERYQPDEHDIGDRLARRELHLIQSVIRELVAMGWVPPVVLRAEIIFAIRTCNAADSAEEFADARIAELIEIAAPAARKQRNRAASARTKRQAKR